MSASIVSLSIIFAKAVFSKCSFFGECEKKLILYWRDRKLFHNIPVFVLLTFNGCLSVSILDIEI